MTDTTVTPDEGGHVSWKRFGAFAGVGAVGIGGVLFALANGAIAAQFVVSDLTFKVSADELVGTGFEQYGGINADRHDEPIPMATAAIQEAELHSMCQSVLIDDELPGLPAVTMNLTAGTGGSPVEAETLLVDMHQMAGDAEFENMDIGVNAPDMDKGPDEGQKIPGMFGMQSDTINVSGLEQEATATTAGSFVLNDLSLNVGFGNNECF
ncbi:DUF6230 family protein [Lipingzhangella sp. LS1_29]|uniref:DUF6230 family protein n=1 Tax=Lipingzhangella rawalii TaxID=2055835 RepID=A0ABU2H510_9ACTN|nr:DUF6230 family protein [Lipingzhangella rawalii]MDS1269704.1 DUF6230 family protein [Lipingzhangella rawalii]